MATDDETVTLIYDIEADAPACAIVQAHVSDEDARVRNEMLSHFDKWITAPNDSMRRITGTVGQWKQVARRSNAVHGRTE